MDTVEAVYVGPLGYALDGGTELIPGESVVELPRGHAEADPHWLVPSGDEPPAQTNTTAPPSGKGKNAAAGGTD